MCISGPVLSAGHHYQRFASLSAGVGSLQSQCKPVSVNRPAICHYGRHCSNSANCTALGPMLTQSQAASLNWQALVRVVKCPLQICQRIILLVLVLRSGHPCAPKCVPFWSLQVASCLPQLSELLIAAPTALKHEQPLRSNLYQVQSCSIASVVSTQGLQGP